MRQSFKVFCRAERSVVIEWRLADLYLNTVKFIQVQKLKKASDNLMKFLLLTDSSLWMTRWRWRFSCMQHKNLSRGDILAGMKGLMKVWYGAWYGVHSVVNASWDKVVEAVAAHVLAVSGRGGVFGCFSAVVDAAWDVGDGLGKTHKYTKLLRLK